MNSQPTRKWCAKIGGATTRAEQYLRSRQSPDGGFCFYRWGGVEESSLADTWHAVAAFALLDVEVPRHDEVIMFLQGSNIAGFDDLCHVAQGLSWLGAATTLSPDWRDRIAALDAEATLADVRLPVASRLEHALRSVRLQQSIFERGSMETLANNVYAMHHDGGWGDKPNLGDTWLALALLDACGAHTFTETTRSFVDCLQIPSFGFTATRDSSYANIDIVHAGIRACNTLGLPLRYPNDAIGYLLACQTDAGGFAPTADALPNIALTHRGLLALAAAGAMPASHKRVRKDPGT